MIKRGVIASLLLVPSAYAVSFNDVDITSAFSTAGDFVKNFLDNPQAVYFLSMFLFFILVYAVMTAVLKKVHIFEGEGGVGINSAGVIVAIALSGLMTISLMTQFRSGEALREGFVIIGENLGLIGIGAFIILMFFLLRWVFAGTYTLGLNRDMISTLAVCALVGALVFASAMFLPLLYFLAGALLLYIIFKIGKWFYQHGMLKKVGFWLLFIVTALGIYFSFVFFPVHALLVGIVFLIVWILYFLRKKLKESKADKSKVKEKEEVKGIKEAEEETKNEEEKEENVEKEEGEAQKEIKEVKKKESEMMILLAKEKALVEELLKEVQ